MIYTKRHPAVLIIGVILLALGYATQAGLFNGVVKFLGTGRLKPEMIHLSYVFGAVGVVIGLLKLLGPLREGSLDYYRSAIGGALFILLIAMLVRWFLAPLVAVWSRAAGPIIGGQYIHSVFGLNYVVLGIMAGLIVVNVFGIPSWAQNGVRMSRLGLKTGVILLGTLYFLQEILHLGVASFTLIGIFVLGSVGLVLLMARMMAVSNSMGGVLSAGVGVCGVSAAVASAPVVQAKSAEIAYTIGTILLWGVGCMFIFPVIGKLLGMSNEAFGAWAGTGILNSAQVAGAALAYQPDGIEALKVAEIFNITRILFLPLIVVWLALWYVRRETVVGGPVPAGHSVGAMSVGAPKVDVWQVIVSKFPLFVIGFIIMFLINLTGVFLPKGVTADNLWKGKYFDNKLKTERLLKDKDLAALRADLPKVKLPAQKAAVERLIANKKVMSLGDVHALDGLSRAKVLSKDSAKAVKSASSAVLHSPKIIGWFRDWIVWLFAFGLTGLGMQITLASLKQAGGQPLVIGGVVGTIKAVGSLVFILIFARMLGLETL
ncbi:MAG: putative sulfate exporter family transporter [Hyphomicrobiaceae bacterium]